MTYSLISGMNGYGNGVRRKRRKKEPVVKKETDEQNEPVVKKETDEQNDPVVKKETDEQKIMRLESTINQLVDQLKKAVSNSSSSSPDPAAPTHHPAAKSAVPAVSPGSVFS